MKRVLMGMLLLCAAAMLSADSSYDRTIEVLDQSRDEKVKQVFREMITAYQDEDPREFFAHVSEARFLQDYITFSDGIHQDFRTLDILQVDYWFERVVPKGVKRFLYVKWEKRYETLKSGARYTQRGYSRFLFDEIEGKYYLIEVAGTPLWAESVAEWREEVPQIPGQRAYEQVVVESTGAVVSSGSGDPGSGGGSGLPDLIVEKIDCPSGYGGAMPVSFSISNMGTAATTQGEIAYVVSGYMGDTYYGDIAPGDSVHISATGDCYPSDTVSVEVDPDNLIDESDESNNANELVL